MTDAAIRTNASSLDVLIVGAGPTGLALATQLQTFGGRTLIPHAAAVKARACVIDRRLSIRCCRAGGITPSSVNPASSRGQGP